MYDTLLACAALAVKEQINFNLEALHLHPHYVGTFLATTQIGPELDRLIEPPPLSIM